MGARRSAGATPPALSDESGGRKSVASPLICDIVSLLSVPLGQPDEPAPPLTGNINNAHSAAAAVVSSARLISRTAPGLFVAASCRGPDSLACLD